MTFANQLDEKKASECMKAAYDAGVNFFDNAEAYAKGESEVLMGRILKKMRWPRDSYCVSSKVYWGGDLPTQLGLSRKHVTDACHNALRRMQVDYLDLYYCHRPDPETPVEETVRAMHDLVSQGKILYWGTSEWSAGQILEACSIARQNHLVLPTMEQPQYNLFWRRKVEVEFEPIYSDLGFGTTTWSPLASGVPTNKYAEGVPTGSRIAVTKFDWMKRRVGTPQWKDEIEKTKKLAKIAKGIDASMAQLAIAWCLKNPHVSSVILGASRASQLKENLGALDVLPQLDSTVMKAIEGILS